MKKLFLLLPLLATGAFAQAPPAQMFHADLERSHCYAWGGDRSTNGFGYCDMPPGPVPVTVIERVVVEGKTVTVEVPGPERIIYKEVKPKKVRE